MRARARTSQTQFGSDEFYICFPWRGEHSPESRIHEKIITMIFFIWKLKMSSSVTGRAHVRGPLGHIVTQNKNLFNFSWRGEHSPESQIFKRNYSCFIFQIIPMWIWKSYFFSSFFDIWQPLYSCLKYIYDKLFPSKM